MKAESIDPRDPRSAFAGLRDRDYARAGLMVLEGRIVIEKALDCGARLRSLLCVPADEAEWRDRSRDRAARPSDGSGSAMAAGGDELAFTVEAMGRADMADLLGFSFHRGTLALADRPAPPDPAALPEGPALGLWNVTDPDNLGALIRSAAALGARRVYLGPGCADPYSRKALRASMACALGLAVVSLAGLGELGLARAGGNAVVAAALTEGAREPGELAAGLAASGRAGRVTLVLGNEGWGLPGEVVAACDERVVVPMARGVDSLNVGAAGAILMWELFRDRPAGAV